MAGETTTTKTAAKAADKASDAKSQAAGAVEGQAADTLIAADASAPQAGTAQPPGEAASVQQAGAAPAPAQRKPVAIEVISRQDGFWRGNRQWTHAPQTVPLRDLTDGEFDEIMEEPLLITRFIYEDGE